MKSKVILSLAVLFTLAIVILISCKKDTTTNQTSTVNFSKVGTENATIDGAFTDAFRQVDQTCKQHNYKDINSCPTVTIDSLAYPMHVTIDYGIACTGNDGVVRSGIIYAALTKPYIDSASVTTVTFSNYIVNTHKITGTEIITNVGKVNGHHVFDVTVQNGNLYSIDGVTTYNSVQQRTWIHGDSTLLNPMDDVYSITGSGSGTTTDGTSYTVSIGTPLQVALNCPWVESGTLNVTVPNYPAITVDYGNGACDDAAVVSCAGYTFNLVMP